MKIYSASYFYIFKGIRIVTKPLRAYVILIMCVWSYLCHVSWVVCDHTSCVLGSVWSDLCHVSWVVATQASGVNWPWPEIYCCELILIPSQMGSSFFKSDVGSLVFSPPQFGQGQVSPDRSDAEEGKVTSLPADCRCVRCINIYLLAVNICSTLLYV